MTSNPWDPERYERDGGFVWRYGHDLVELLSPRPGERVLDAGCGTGQLTALIAESGADVVGIDRSPEMVVAAARNYPELRFEVADVRGLPYRGEFDAVFSNAVLHWVLPPEPAVDSIRRALVPGGRFVAELGGAGNIGAIIEAVRWARRGDPGPKAEDAFFFPSAAEYTAMLESHGFDVERADLFERPTPLDGGEDGLRLWLDTFAGGLLDGLSGAQRATVVGSVEARLRPRLHRDGQWTADYVRLRVVARRRERRPAPGGTQT